MLIHAFTPLQCKSESSTIELLGESTTIACKCSGKSPLAVVVRGTSAYHVAVTPRVDYASTRSAGTLAERVVALTWTITITSLHVAEVSPKMTSVNELLKDLNPAQLQGLLFLVAMHLERSSNSC